MIAPFSNTDEGCQIRVKLQPRSNRDAIGERFGDELKIHLQAAPVDGAANQSLLRFLSEKLACPKRQIRIVRGERSRHKTIAITGLNAEDAAERLGL